MATSTAARSRQPHSALDSEDGAALRQVASRRPSSSQSSARPLSSAWKPFPVSPLRSRCRTSRSRCTTWRSLR